MGAITLSPTPPKGPGLGYWQDTDQQLKQLVANLTDMASNFTTGNTVAEVQTLVTAAIAALSDVI